MEASVFMRCRLFQGLPEAKLPPLLEQLHGYRRSYEKGRPVYRVGDTAHALCVLLSGGVTIERDDAWGNKTILDHIGPGAVFAETYACVPGTPMMVSAVAAEPSEVLFLPMDHLLAPAGREDSGRDVLLRNLLDVTARKNLTLTRKDLPHNAEIPARQAVVLSVRAGRAERLRYVRYPVRPPAACRLSRRGPQRPVERAEQNAAGRAALLP